MMDPDWAAAFPTDDGLVFYAAMPTMDAAAASSRPTRVAALVDYFDAAAGSALAALGAG